MATRLSWRINLLFLAAALVGCDVTGGSGIAEQAVGGGLPDPESFSLHASSDAGMVVSGNPYATHAGVQMLEAGGNAADAAVATAFALAVVEPSQSGLGGRTQALTRLPDGAFHGIDGTTQVPRGYDAATAPSVEHGYPTVAIPGTVKALTRLLAEHGTLPLEQVLAPAIRYAEGGFPLTPGEARRIAGVAEGLRGFQAAAGYFLRPDGSPYEGGDTLVQADLAEVLRTVAREGGDAFYLGDLARRMVRDFQANGGYVTLRDLGEYQAEDAVLARGSYRGREVVGTYLPASGATVIEILQILENFPMGDFTEGDRAAVLSQALLLGFEDRDETQFDPPEEVVAKLTSKDWAAARARKVRVSGPRVARGADNSFKGVPGASGDHLPRQGSTAPVGEWPNTTHISVADDRGMVVAMTQSLGPTLGSWVATPGLGFVYAATTGGYLADAPPGGRPWSSQAPLVVLEKGTPRYVLGGAGARRIVSALVSVVGRLVDEGMDITEALAAPRLHPSGNEVTLERVEGAALDAAGVEVAVEGFGFEVASRPFDTWFALLNAVEVRPEGLPALPRFTGAADPRWAWGGAGGASQRE